MKRTLIITLLAVAIIGAALPYAPVDFLKKTLPWFENPGIGMVQTRWGHLNENYSLLTWIQSIFLDGHFLQRCGRVQGGKRHWALNRGAQLPRGKAATRHSHTRTLFHPGAGCPQSDQPNKCAACVIAAPARMAAATTAVSASCASVAPAFRASLV